MEFLLAFQQGLTPPAASDAAPPPAMRQQLGLDWRNYMAAMAAAGVLRGAKQLDPSSSVIVGCEPASAPSDAQRRALQLSGYALIDVASLKEALEWAERSPANRGGCTQVLPVLPVPGAP